MDVLIESDWNLKGLGALIETPGFIVLIESDWNLKDDSKEVE